jgi:large subunit ribosomal protein L15
VNLRDLERFQAGTEVTPELLKKSGVLRTLRRPVKVLAMGELTKALTVKAHKFSMTAKAKIEAAGGAAQEIGPSAELRTGDGGGS